MDSELFHFPLKWREVLNKGLLESTIFRDKVAPRIFFTKIKTSNRWYPIILATFRDSILQEHVLGSLWHLMKSHEIVVCSRSKAAESAEISDAASLYLPLLDIACFHVPSLYANWFYSLERRERLSRELEKVSALLQAQQSISGNPSKRSGWISASLNARERVKRVGVAWKYFQ